MLDPSLGATFERVPRFRPSERMAHPAARPIPCQTSVRPACRHTKLVASAVSPGPLRLRRRLRVQTGPMTAEKKAEVKAEEKKAEEQAAPETLPPEMTAALAAFERHLRAERSLSPHTVRAYLGDVSSLLEHAHQAGVQAPEGLDATHLRGWLASQHGSGAARTTLARRGAAARTFTAFAYRRGWLATDPGPQLGTLKTRRTLPYVLRQDEMRSVLDTANRAAEAGTPQADKAVALRDAAVLELLYATGIRVSELCALTPDSFDHARRTVRVRGKGDKERTVPVGMPALRAVSAWLDQGRPALATASSGAALFLGARGGRLDPRT